MDQSSPHPQQRTAKVNQCHRPHRLKDEHLGKAFPLQLTEPRITMVLLNPVIEVPEGSMIECRQMSKLDDGQFSGHAHSCGILFASHLSKRGACRERNQRIL